MGHAASTAWGTRGSVVEVSRAGRRRHPARCRVRVRSGSSPRSLPAVMRMSNASRSPSRASRTNSDFVTDPSPSPFDHRCRPAINRIGGNDARMVQRMAEGPDGWMPPLLDDNQKARAHLRRWSWCTGLPVARDLGGRATPSALPSRPWSVQGDGDGLAVTVRCGSMRRSDRVRRGSRHSCPADNSCRSPSASHRRPRCTRCRPDPCRR